MSGGLNRALATGQAARDYNPLRVLQELEAAIGYRDGYVIPLGKSQDAWLYRLLVDTVLFHAGGDNAPRRQAGPLSTSLLTRARVDAGRELASSMLLPVIGKIRATGGDAAAVDMVIGAITQLAGALVHHQGPQQAALDLGAIVSAVAQYKGPA